jgi:hypothetical protein
MKASNKPLQWEAVTEESRRRLEGKPCVTSFRPESDARFGLPRKYVADIGVASFGYRIAECVLELPQIPDELIGTN